MGIEIRVTDQRSIEIPIRTSGDDLAAVGVFIQRCAEQSYELHVVEAIQGGQRDPITSGVRLVFSRKT